MNRLELAELTSGVGALGVGLGAPFLEWFGRLAGVITVVGLSLHAFGSHSPIRRLAALRWRFGCFAR